MCSLLKIWKILSPKELRKKTKKKQNHQDCITSSVHLVRSLCTLILSPHGTCSPREKLGSACSFLISSQIFVLNQVSRIGTRNVVLSHLSSEGFWKPRLAVSLPCHLEDSMLPVCVPNPVAFPGIQLPSSLCRGSEQLRNLGCPERELNYWHKHLYTASHECNCQIPSVLLLIFSTSCQTFDSG